MGKNAVEVIKLLQFGRRHLEAQEPQVLVVKGVVGELLGQGGDQLTALVPAGCLVVDRWVVDGGRWMGGSGWVGSGWVGSG